MVDAIHNTAPLAPSEGAVPTEASLINMPPSDVKTAADMYHAIKFSGPRSRHNPVPNDQSAIMLKRKCGNVAWENALPSSGSARPEKAW